jgi:hypothetical protein
MRVGETEHELTEGIDVAQNKTKLQGFVNKVMDITVF